MKYILLFWILLSSAIAAPRVVILTSVAESKLERQISTYAQKHLKDFEVELKIKATQDELYAALLSRPDGIIWVSHGSTEQAQVGYGAISQILDYKKDDISPLFQMLSDKTQFLGVVSCFSLMALNAQSVDLKQLKGSYFSKNKVLGFRGFKKAVKALKKTQFITTIATRTPSQSELLIERTGGNGISLKVFNQKKFLGLVQGNFAKLKVSNISGNIRIELPKYLDVPKESAWGQINLSLEQHMYRAFSDNSGRPFGTYSRVFIK